MYAKKNHHAVFLLATTLVVALTATAAVASKDHCRTLKLDGSAGDTSTDSVTFRLVDENGVTVVDQSCQITVKQSEDANEFGERLPIQWFLDDPTLAASPCPTDAEALFRATKPNGMVKYPKKICSESSGGSGPSCRVKFTYKVKKSTNEVKKGPQLDICCYETPDCKGTKWGSTTSKPINLQVRNNNVAIDFLPSPASLPAVVGAISDLVVDPIGLEQLPSPQVNACRAEIATDIERLTNEMAAVLLACHSSPGVPDQAVCNAISPASDPTGSIANAVTNLRQQVRNACSGLGSPSKFSYGACPAPCAGLISPPTCVGGPNDGSPCRTDAECDTASFCVEGLVGPPCTVDAECGLTGRPCLGSGFCVGPVCSVASDCNTAPGTGDGKCIRKGDGVCKNRCSAPAINLGAPCSVEADCDSTVGAGDGRCADWGQVGDCAACLTRAAVENAFLQAFGPSGSPINTLSPEALNCKLALGLAMLKLQRTEIKETRTCQGRLDGGKTALPVATKKCKDADPKHRRARAVANMRGLIVEKACPFGEISELDSCGADAEEVVQCTVAAIKKVNQAYGIAAIPDSRCGDAKRIGEECDDGNLLNGDGCADDCTCEGICGDGVLNPVAACGEFCDDGNQINGDGCENNCTLTPPGGSS